MSRPETPDGTVEHGEMGMVLAEIRRLGRAVDSLTEKLDERLGALSRDVSDAKVREAILRTQLEAAQAEIVSLKTQHANHATAIGALQTASAVTGSKLALIIGAAATIAAGIVKALAAFFH